MSINNEVKALHSDARKHGQNELEDQTCGIPPEKRTNCNNILGVMFCRRRHYCSIFTLFSVRVVNRCMDKRFTPEPRSSVLQFGGHVSGRRDQTFDSEKLQGRDDGLDSEREPE